MSAEYLGGWMSGYFDEEQHTWDYDIAGRRLAESLKDDGHALVELPAPMADRSGVAEAIRALPMWQAGDAWTCLTDPNCIEFEAAGQTEYGTLTVEEARSLAAALLAAADAAEHPGTPVEQETK